jgi:hypothetical protein
MSLANGRENMTKGHKGVVYANKDNIDAKMNRLIEGDNECDRMSARMLKAQVPLMREIIESEDLSKLSGFVRGISNIIVSMIISLPSDMREAVHACILADIERAMKIKLPDKEEEK